MKKIFILLIVLTVVLPANLLADCKTKPPSRTKFEEMFGKSKDCYPKGTTCLDLKEQKKIECPALPEGTLCYRKLGVYFKAIFDAENNLKQLNMSGDFAYTYDNASQLIPESWKELRAESERKKIGRIETFSDGSEKFSNDCLELESRFENDLVTDYVPFIMNIKWK